MSTYRGQHTAPGWESAPLYDVTLNGIYPRKFYSEPARWWVDDSPGSWKAYGIVTSARGKPGQLLRVYRAVPKSVKGTGRTNINPGDWVTITKGYATDHGRSALRGEFRVLSREVFAVDLYTDGNSMQEWGYFPAPEPQKYLLMASYALGRLRHKRTEAKARGEETKKLDRAIRRHEHQIEVFSRGSR